MKCFMQKVMEKNKTKTPNIKTALISVENGLIAIGFRKIAAVVKAVIPDSKICFYPPAPKTGSIVRFFKDILNDTPLDSSSTNNDINAFALLLSQFDLVLFSSMTPFSDITKKILKEIKLINSKVFCVWGGVHPTVYPQDAINFADAICIGEGEMAVKEFLETYISRGKYKKTRSFWFKEDGGIIKNQLRPLHTQDEMDKFPFPWYAEDEFIWKKKSQILVPVTTKDYLISNSLGYSTTWSIGCPNRCIYCANSLFLKNQPLYGRLRHPSVDYLIGEIKHALKKHPYISIIDIEDDSFFSLKMEIIEEFCAKWTREVKLPFLIGGINQTMFLTKR